MFKGLRIRQFVEEVMMIGAGEIKIYTNSLGFNFKRKKLGLSVAFLELEFKILKLTTARNHKTE